MIKYIFITIIVIYVLLSMLLSNLLNKEIAKYSNIRVSSDMDTIVILKNVLKKNNINDIHFYYDANVINSFYDVKLKSLYLSKNINSLSYRIIAFHELGHILQDNTKYRPLLIKTKLSPLFNMLSVLMPLLLVIGLLSINSILYIGIILFVICVISNILTVTIEKDASKRGFEIARQTNSLNANELEKMDSILELSKKAYIFSLFSVFSKFRKSIFNKKIPV